MNAIDFLKSKGIIRATCYTDGRTYYVDGLAELMEEYAALHQPTVSGQLNCCKGNIDNGYIQLCSKCLETFGEYM